MVDNSIAHQLTFLTIATEIRQNIYHQLFAVESNRNLHLCSECNWVWVSPPLPLEILLTCHQAHDEGIAIIESCYRDVKLVVDEFWSLSHHESPSAENHKLAKYGKFVTEILLNVAYADNININIRGLLGHCTEIKKLVVDVSMYRISTFGHEEKTEDWWLNSDEVRDWLWRYWIAEGLGPYLDYFDLMAILNGKKGEGQTYSVNFIATFIMPGRENTLYIIFDRDTGATLQRWITKPFVTTQQQHNDGEDDDRDDRDGGKDDKEDGGSIDAEHKDSNEDEVIPTGNEDDAQDGAVEISQRGDS